MSAPPRFAAASDVARIFGGAPPVVWIELRADLNRIARHDIVRQGQGGTDSVDLEIDVDEDLTVAIEDAAYRANVSVEDYLRQAIQRYAGLAASDCSVSPAQQLDGPSPETDIG